MHHLYIYILSSGGSTEFSCIMIELFFLFSYKFFFFILELVYEVRCGSNEYFPPHMQKPQNLWKSSNLGNSLQSSHAFSVKFT